MDERVKTWLDKFSTPEELEQAVVDWLTGEGDVYLQGGHLIEQTEDIVIDALHELQEDDARAKAIARGWNRVRTKLEAKLAEVKELNDDDRWMFHRTFAVAEISGSVLLRNGVFASLQSALDNPSVTTGMLQEIVAAAKNVPASFTDRRIWSELRKIDSICAYADQAIKKIPAHGMKKFSMVKGDRFTKRHRFLPSQISSHRQRLGLSAEQYGKLVGVSALKIYSWEQGRTRPSVHYLRKLTQIQSRGLRNINVLSPDTLD